MQVNGYRTIPRLSKRIELETHIGIYAEVAPFLAKKYIFGLGVPIEEAA